MNSRMKNIAMGARSQMVFLMVAVARSLKEKHGSTIHLYCSTIEEEKYYRTKFGDVFASIVIVDSAQARAFDTDLDEEKVFESARRHESFIGETINRLIVPDRHFGRGYSLGGYYHPRSVTSEETTYLQAVNAHCKELDFWEREFKEKSITLALNCPVIAYFVGKAMGIPYRALAGSRYKNLHYWAWNSMYENPLFAKTYESKSGSDDLQLLEPYHSHLSARKTYKNKFTFRTLVQRSVYLIAQRAYWKYRGYEKGKVGYYLSQSLQLLYRMWREYARLMRMPLVKLEDLKGKKFAYFPMHIEPETALHGISPEYFYQHSLIAAVSRDLPADTILAVKEPYGMIGRRPDHFYRQILDLKNVVMFDPWEIGIKCAQTADVVVTICGTAGLEAVAAGKPVISFGHHNMYNSLPSVRVVSDESKLKGYLADALSGKTPASEIRAEASRLLSAIVDCSFDLGEYDYIDLENFTQEYVELAVDALGESATAHEELDLSA